MGNVISSLLGIQVRESEQSRESEEFYSAEGLTVRSRNLTYYLKAVEAQFKPEKEEKRKNVETMNTVLEFLIKQMKDVDELFDYLYRDIFYTGSFYDGLRITSASEFDLNIILALPFKKSDRDFQEDDDYPAYGKYQLRAPATVLMEKMTKNPPKNLAEYFDADNYFLPKKIRSWLQRVLAKVWNQCYLEIDDFMQDNEIKEIERKESGPALTLVITTWDGREVDVDLVPVIEFRYPDWPYGAEQYVPLDSNDGVWFLVPKPYSKTSEPQDDDVLRLWRLHFPRIERRLLGKLLHVKPLIKFLKKLRDENNWKILASYYLKTFVIWETRWETRYSEYEMWSRDLGELFLEVLHKLSKTVRSRDLPYLFYPRYNLLQSMRQGEADNISNRIDRIISSIQRDPQRVLFYLGYRGAGQV